ncbi:long-chain fatty acid transport protein 2-like [Takifugu flavidus]|uniref:long-chain fatty acid transport protein 2-like n=1 Tax=Takifugu flavidus TaxID=433684 RepID=UPI002544C8AC|nr:long-chain fatty acid transport protein 2-like [Takifugu flavidus]
MLVWIVVAALLLLLLLFSRHPHFVQDVRHVRRRLKARRQIEERFKRNYLILDRFLEVVETQPHTLFIRFKDESYTYGDAEELSSKAARVFLQSGRVKQGDTVALFLGNKPIFLFLWLGLLKIGCPVAFLNHNVRSKSLLHCFSRCGAKTLVADEELLDAVEEVLPTLLEQQVHVYILADRCKTSHVDTFNDKMRRASGEPVPRELRSSVTPGSTAVYIYTSGTTGLPKAAAITHAKVQGLSLLFSFIGVTSKDVLYLTLPLYHSAGFLGCTSAIESGFTIVLRSKFSASQFWDDCRKYNVTIIQYIGEIMRYLCNTPQKFNDRSHRVRFALGNGMRPEVWREFLSRFGNIQIAEFYGATEGNFFLLNYSGKIGAVGRDFYLHRRYFPYSLIKYDVDQDKPLRDSAGFCIRATRGEPGLLVCEISPAAPFSGYERDEQQTEKKKLHNVHKKGDLYFNTGDLFTIDSEGFFYFNDRVGDTFRWKGENVSTAEVADVLTFLDCIKHVTVYGVHVPDQEGRAGMAAVSVTDGHFDSVRVFKHVERFLPTYARPRFIRIKASLDVTGTFKYVKMKLVADGFDPNRITDPLYFLDEKVRDYVPLTQDIFNAVSSGKIKI